MITGFITKSEFHKVYIEINAQSFNKMLHFKVYFVF